MASKIGLSYRNEAAQARLGKALAELKEFCGGVEPRPIGSRRDGALEATLRLEWMADLVERVALGVAEREEERTGLSMRIRELEAELAKATTSKPSGQAQKARRGE